jgi:hypothetical protein
VAADIVGDLAAARRMADQNDVLEVERLDQRREIVGVGVHVVAEVRLVRAAVAAPVMCDHAEAVVEHEQHLPVPGVTAERPAMGKEDGLRVLRAPVLDEDAGAVGGDDEAHDIGPFVGGATKLPRSLAKFVTDAGQICAWPPSTKSSTPLM